MKIGFVSTWFERGAAYVTKAYVDILKEKNEVFVYARGGEEYAQGNVKWDHKYVTWGKKLVGTNINFKDIKKWIIKNELEIIFFNEQHEFHIIQLIKREFPNIKLGAYIDYYKENTVDYFDVYDFLICNTKRHQSVFKNHKQSYYIAWGTDLDLFKPMDRNKYILEEEDEIIFFHSVGMSYRKGTKILVDAFIDGKLYEKSKLILHSQLDINKAFGLTKEELNKFNIEVHENTVSAPGLYKLADVYVYPTTLDGLGLTLYEALACGMPVITTNNGPMNEVINNGIGRLIDVDYFRSRSDGYYWPLSICNKESLIESMIFYIENKEILNHQKKKSRQEALEKWNWKDRQREIQNIFSSAISDSNFVNKVDLNLIDRIRFKVLTNAFLYMLYKKLKS